MKRFLYWWDSKFNKYKPTDCEIRNRQEFNKKCDARLDRLSAFALEQSSREGKILKGTRGHLAQMALKMNCPVCGEPISEHYFGYIHPPGINPYGCEDHDPSIHPTRRRLGALQFWGVMA
jgi:hypothetical protein